MRFGRIQRCEKRAFFVCLGKFHVRAIGIFDAVGLFGLGQDVVGAFEALDQVFTVVGVERLGQRAGAFDQKRQIVIPGMAMQASMMSWRTP